jgi:hypothetical protein
MRMRMMDMLGDLEEQILADISEWAVRKYGIAAMNMLPQDLANQYWKEQFE